MNVLKIMNLVNKEKCWQYVIQLCYTPTLG